MAKIYVASSWRNVHQPEVVKTLRENLHAVYDFRKDGFSWKSIDGDWEKWIPAQYLRALKHPLAEKGFQRDMDALKWCEICVYIMPCGPSASMELGWAAGHGKHTIVYVPQQTEPDLMVKMASIITSSMADVLEFCSNFDKQNE